MKINEYIKDGTSYFNRIYDDTKDAAIYLATGLVISVALTVGVGSCLVLADKANPKMTIVSVSPWGDCRNTEPITITEKKEGKLKLYIDEKPFGSLDTVVDYTTGERCERKPTKYERMHFSNLENEAQKNALIPTKLQLKP